MARIRSIKPEFWTSSQIVECSLPARLMFIGLWTFADDGGRHLASLRRLKMEVFPGDPCTDADMAAWMSELVQVGLVAQYKVDERQYWQITGWDRHQTTQRPTYLHPQVDGTIPVSHNGQRYGNTKPENCNTNSRNVPSSFQEQSRNVPSSFQAHSNHDTTQTNTTRHIPFVRSIVATDHLEVWPDALRQALTFAKRLWPGRPLKEIPFRDRTELKKYAFLSKVVLGENWLADAVEGTVQKRPKKPAAYLKKILRETAAKAGHDLHELLDAVEIPEKPPAQCPPVDLATSIGHMPDQDGHPYGVASPHDASRGSLVGTPCHPR